MVDINTLAKLLHKAWFKVRVDQGWQSPKKYQRDQIVHQDLVPWSKLRKVVKEDYLAVATELLKLIT